MSEPTIRIEITENEVDCILDGARTTAGICEPDPRENPDHMEYLKGGLRGKELDEHVKDLCERWDARYAFLKKWERRKNRFSLKRDS